jgi:hypothetical protein
MTNRRRSTFSVWIVLAVLLVLQSVAVLGHGPIVASDTATRDLQRYCDLSGQNVKEKLLGLPFLEVVELAHMLLTQHYLKSGACLSTGGSPPSEFPISNNSSFPSSSQTHASGSFTMPTAVLAPPPWSRRRLLQTGPANVDVDGPTYEVLQQVAQLCSATSGCTCFNGTAALSRPVCGSTWAICNVQGQLTSLYVKR